MKINIISDVLLVNCFGRRIMDEKTKQVRAIVITTFMPLKQFLDEPLFNWQRIVSF